MQSTIGSTSQERAPLANQLNAQILNFAEKYQKAIQKFQSAQSYLLYHQQMQYYASINSENSRTPSYPFIITHSAEKNEFLVF
jgi:hypothetical protein